MASVVATPNMSIEVVTGGLITLDTSRILTMNCPFTAPR
jgi:hypothetical protein